jgi:RNA-directed DNA polymerase
LDEWFIKEIQPRLGGESFIIRFADDFLLGFTHEEDAIRVMEILFKRFTKYGITLRRRSVSRLVDAAIFCHRTENGVPVRRVPEAGLG